MDRLSRGHVVQRAEPFRSRIFGNAAVATAVLHLPGDEEYLVVEVLVKRGGRWSVQWPLGVITLREAMDRYDPAARSEGSSR